MKTSDRRTHCTLARGWTVVVAIALLAAALAAPASAAASGGFTPSSLSLSRSNGVLSASATAFIGDIASELPINWLPSEGYVRLSVVSPSGGLICLPSPFPCVTNFVETEYVTGATLDFHFNEVATFTLEAQAVDYTLGHYFPAPGIAPVTITVDVRATATALPTVTITSPSDGTRYALGETVLADYSCTADAGLASCVGPVPSGSAIDTSTVGTHTFTVTATDDLDQTAATTVSYHVGYDFGGFLAPAPETADSATAGSAIPLRFRITAADGSSVTDLDPAKVSVDVTSLSCTLGSSEDLPFETAGDSMLQSLGDGYYRLVWKTSRTYADSCKTVSLDLGDGVAHDLEVDFVR